MIEFTYDWYFSLIERLREYDYKVSFYDAASDLNRNVIIRHDVDFNLKKAVEFAAAENEHGVSSTYFILLSTDFYNVFSTSGRKYLKEILRYGHKIGLHYDETVYGKETDCCDNISKECSILAEAVGERIGCVSMHRPSKKMLESDIRIEGIINSYSNYFFQHYKYFSDSRMKWREDVDAAVDSQSYNQLHILTHPFWYFDKEKSMREIVTDFITNASNERYYEMKENITDIDSIMENKK